MAYTLQRDEPVGAEIRRVIRELGEESIRLVEDDGPIDDRIHEIRKALKKIRAALRLVRPVLPVYRRENRRYRDAGRLLSDLRDSAARIETVDALDDVLRRDLEPETVTALREALVEARIAEFSSIDVNERLANVRERVAEGLAELETVRTEADGFDAVRGGLAKTYGRALRLRRESIEDADPEVFHTWRKRVKYHRYHVDLLEELHRGLNRREQELHNLTDDLGLTNDLAVLGRFLDRNPEVLPPEATEDLRKALDDASASARSSAHERADQVFAADTGEFCERFENYWNEWKGTPDD